MEGEGEERKDGGAAVLREDRDEGRGNGGADRSKRREKEREEPYRPPRGRDRGSREEGGDREKQQRRGQRGGSRSRSHSDSLNSTDRKKKRIEESKRQESTIFVGDLDPETTAEQLTGLFKRFGCVLSSKIKENHCYGFVTFEKKQSAEAAIAAGQNRDGIELLNGKQVTFVTFLFQFVLQLCVLTNLKVHVRVFCIFDFFVCFVSADFARFGLIVTFPGSLGFIGVPRLSKMFSMWTASFGDCTFTCRESCSNSS